MKIPWFWKKKKEDDLDLEQLSRDLENDIAILEELAASYEAEAKLERKLAELSEKMTKHDS